jgi:acetyl esterase/lipase
MEGTCLAIFSMRIIPAPRLRRCIQPILAIAGMLIAVAGCSPLGLLDAVTPAGEYKATLDIAYGSERRQRLDIYVPAQPSTMRTVVVFFYGGSWQQGDKDGYRFVAEALTRQGHIVVIPDYRIYPSVVFPSFVEDSARAVAWTVGNVARYGGSPDAVYLMGHSAGAYNAAMLALDTPYLRVAGVARSRLAGVIGIAGPYDFLPLTDPTLRTIFGPEAMRARTQPINFVDFSAPPMLLVTGADDTTVRPGNTHRLAARLREVGANVREITYRDKGHIDIILGLSSRLRGSSRLLDDIEAFVQAR